MGDLKEIINSLLEKRGYYQTIIIILICLNSIQIGINHTITSFHTYVPKFYCKDNVTAQCNVFVNGTECPSGYYFNTTDDYTVASEWGLVCDRGLIAPLINTLYFIGVTFGALICGTLADLWGRKFLVIACMYLQAIMSIGIAFNKNLIIFMILRMLQGFFIQGLQNCSYTLMLEYCPSYLRTLTAVFWELNWAVGLGILGISSYYVRDWRHLTLVLLIPTVLSLFYFWIFPESITWLYAKGKYGKALRLTRFIAKKNSDDIILDECNKVTLDEKIERTLNNDSGTDATIALNDNESIKDDKRYNTKTITTTNDDDIEEKTSLLDIVQNAILRKHLIIMLCVWFSVTLSYYGVLYLLPDLPGQRHLNFLIGAGVEALAYVIAYFVLSRFGRRIPMTAYQYANGVLCICIGLILLADQKSEVTNWSLIIIALIAKGLAVSSFCGMFIYCSELFPTICRGIALGLCGFAARCGSLLAPQLMILTKYGYPAYIPMIVLASGLLITGTATMILPETLSSRLPSTVEEANQLWGKKQK